EGGRRARVRGARDRRAEPGRRAGRARLPDAPRVLAERIAGRGVRPGTAPSAPLAIFAPAAATAQPAGVAQGAEERRLAVDGDQVHLADVPHRERQEPARTDLPQVIDEDEA